MEGFQNDEFQIYRGRDFHLKDGIVIHQPTLDEICQYGEQDYYSMVYTLTLVPADMKWQLYEMGADYTKINDFELFCKILCWEFPQARTAILFGDLNFSNFEIYQKKDHNDFKLYDADHDITIDEYTYLLMTDILRKMHGFKRNDELPGNETTKKILIEDAREQYLQSKNKEYHSQLKNLVSTLINCEGFKGSHETIWNMKIHTFMDAVKRIQKIRNASLLLQSGYSGFGVNLKDISKKQLDYFGDLD